jgi:hypothetical protein
VDGDRGDERARPAGCKPAVTESSIAIPVIVISDLPLALPQVVEVTSARAWSSGAQ